MRAVFLDYPEAALAERRAKGLDTLDEMWEGVLHVVPPPSAGHQRVGMILFARLLDLAEERAPEGFEHVDDVFAPGESVNLVERIKRAAIYSVMKGAMKFMDSIRNEQEFLSAFLLQKNALNYWPETWCRRLTIA